MCVRVGGATDPTRPLTHLEVVCGLFDDLRGHPERSSDKRVPLNLRVCELTSHAEIRQLHVPLLRQQHVGSCNTHTGLQQCVLGFYTLKPTVCPECGSLSHTITRKPNRSMWEELEIVHVTDWSRLFILISCWVSALYRCPKDALVPSVAFLRQFGLKFPRNLVFLPRLKVLAPHLHLVPHTH